MSITVYFRHKTNQGWRYEALGIGRRPEAAKNGPFYIRVREKGKYRWEKHLSELAAKKAADTAPVERKAQALGLIADDLTDETNTGRIPIKVAVESYCTSGGSAAREASAFTGTSSTSFSGISPKAFGLSINWRIRGLSARTWSFSAARGTATKQSAHAWDSSSLFLKRTVLRDPRGLSSYPRCSGPEPRPTTRMNSANCSRR
jgi:hypothetical protein